VRSVANATSLPTTVGERNGIVVEGAPRPADDAVPFVLFASVSDDYFRTLRIPLRQGRTFDAQDRAGVPPVIVISESMARRYWPSGDALGARLRMGPDPNSPLITVVGIVGDVRNDPTRADAEPMAYGTSRQSPWLATTFLIRTAGDPLALAGAARREVRALDATVPIVQVATLRAIVGENLAGRRLPVVLMTAFGALALLLASVGVYAMFANMAAAREREFGVRVALGSSRGAIAGLVLRQGATWMAVGLLGGAVGVVLVARFVGDLLYGVAPFDPMVLTVTVATLLLCAAIALLVPIRRATRVDPITVLR
jgi:predicted permease